MKTNINELPSFLGWEIKTPGVYVDYQEKFDVLYNDDGVLILLSKENYRYPEDDMIPEFEYKYIVRCRDLYHFTQDIREIRVETYMVPIPECVNFENLDNGIKKDYYYQDILDYEFCPYFGSETIPYTEEELKDEWYNFFYDVTENDNLVKMLNVAASTLMAIDSFAGFKMDQTINGLGTTNWDLLEHILLGKNWVSESLNRLKQVSGL